MDTKDWTKEDFKRVLPAHYIFTKEHTIKAYQDAFDHWKSNETLKKELLA